MRTTLQLNDALARRAKRAAAEHGTTLTALVEDGLRQALARLTARPRRPVKLRAFRGNGARPGVDLSRTSSLLALLDSGG